LGSTVSGWLGWLGVVMFYWGKTFFLVDLVGQLFQPGLNQDGTSEKEEE